MWVLASLILGLALVLAMRRLSHHHRALSLLHQAMLQKQPLLREDIPGASGPAWDALCAATNEMIGEVRRLEQQRSGELTQLEATLGSLQEAVLIADSDNYILLANQALHAMFPHAGGALNQRLELVLQSAEFLNYLSAVRHANAAPRHEIEFARPDGARWVEATGTTITSPPGPRGPWVLCVLHDITRQKQLERVRKEFVANVSHELRTPLSVIKGYLETLIEDHQTMPLPERARFLATAHRHAERLNALLEDLLALSRLESADPGLRRESVHLPRLLEGILADYHARRGSDGHVLDQQLDPAVPVLLLDPLKLTQVFENLIDNAIKHTPAGTRIHVELTQQDRAVVACVRDDGPGIPAEDLPHVFERFYRVDKGRSREKGGTGLGLSIVKHIAQLHGGRVWAESEAGQGSAFFLTLPMEADAT